MKFNRRQFVKGSAIAAASTFVGCTASGGKFPTVAPAIARFRKPNEKLNIGVIAVGGKGWSNWEPMFGMGENIVALCDVDRTSVDRALKHMEGKGASTKDVKCYSDYRKMLDECKNLDAVLVSTPDHTHAPAAIRAMKMGMHAYVEKPLVRTIWELGYFEKVAKTNGVVTQMGNQGSASDGFRRNVEVLSSGILGNVTEVHVWTNRPVWPQGMLRPEGSDPIPSSLDWDSWLGTAPVVPFKKDTYPFKWRGFFDYGTGAFGDMACHTMNLPFRGLKLGKVVSAECLKIEGKNKDSFPSKSIVKMTYAARGTMPEVALFWYDGNLKPSADIMPPVIATLGEVPKTGCLVIGDKGMLVSTNDYGADAYIALKGDAKMKSVAKGDTFASIPTFLPRGSEHHREFVQACKGQGKCLSDVEHSIPLLEGMLVGCIAQRVPGKLAWNSAKQSFANNADANLLLTPHIRKGWEF